MKTIFKQVMLLPGIPIFLVLLSGCSGHNIPAPAATLSPSASPDAAVVMLSPTALPPENTPVHEPASTPTFPVNPEPGADKASFIGETYPDNSILEPGESFIKSFEIFNSGTATWTTAYALVLDPAVQSETLGSPPEIRFLQDVSPGENIVLDISLLAPVDPGTYTTYWAIKNQYGETVPVDGGQHIWARILVCPSGQTCAPAIAGGGLSAGDISVSLVNFTSNSQNTTASFCMTLPDRNYGPSSAGSVSLILDQHIIPASSGGSQGIGCFEFEFPAAQTQVLQASQVAVSISQVRVLGGPNDPDASCLEIRPLLLARYPGLDFQCGFSMSGYYANLQLPAGMTPEQADQIITDAVEGTINGPWTLPIR